MKRNTTILLLLLLTLLLSPTAIYADSRPTVRQQMEKVKDRYGVKFVYDSSTKLDVPCVGLPSEGASLKKLSVSTFQKHRAEMGAEGQLCHPAAAKEVHPERLCLPGGRRDGDQRHRL